MAEVINLRMARKAKARAASDKVAEANRAKFGQTKGEKAAHKAEVARLDRDLDGAKREQD